jgi:O-antigen ligase/Flp pilus assembly protein TadD
METQTQPIEPLRQAIVWSVIGCLVVAMAPWLSGGQEPLAQLLSAFSLLLGSVLLGRQTYIRKLKYGPLTATYYALVVWALSSLFWTVNRYSTIEWVIGLVMVGLAFRLAYSLSGDSLWRTRFLGLYVASAALFSGFGLYLYLTSGYERFTSSFYWPNPAASYLLPALFLTYDHWRRGGKWVQIVLIAVLGSSFALADSRATMAVAIIIGSLYVLLVRKNKRFWITSVLSIGIILGATYGAIQLRSILQPHVVTRAPGSRLAPSSATNSQSGNDRLEYLKSALAIWESHPILGTGAGTFANVHPKYQGRVISASTSAHNLYVQTLAEQGLIGALLLLAFILALAGGIIRSISRIPHAWVVAFGLAALLLHFGLDIDAQYPAMLLLTAVLSGTIYYQKPASGSLGWLPIVASFLVLIPVIGIYLSDNKAQRGRMAQVDGDYALAASYFTQARSYLVYDPDVLSAEGIDRYTLGLSGDKGQTSQALLLARSAERQDPFDGQHHQLAGRILNAEGKSSESEREFELALTLDPFNHPDYAYDLAQSQLHQGKQDLALATLMSMLNQYPAGVIANRSTDTNVAQNLATLEVLVGTIHLQQGDLVLAQSDAHKAIMMAPDSLRAQAFQSVIDRTQPQVP